MNLCQSFVAHTVTFKFDFIEYLVTIFGHYISRTIIAELRKALEAGSTRMAKESEIWCKKVAMLATSRR